MFYLMFMSPSLPSSLVIFHKLTSSMVIFFTKFNGHLLYLVQWSLSLPISMVTFNDCCHLISGLFRRTVDNGWTIKVVLVTLFCHLRAQIKGNVSLQSHREKQVRSEMKINLTRNSSHKATHNERWRPECSLGVTRPTLWDLSIISRIV